MGRIAELLTYHTGITLYYISVQGSNLRFEIKGPIITKLTVALNKEGKKEGIRKIVLTSCSVASALCHGKPVHDFFVGSLGGWKFGKIVLSIPDEVLVMQYR